MKKTVTKIVGVASLLLVALTFAPSSYATVTLDVQGGQLMGVSGVELSGSLYDVAFGDIPCDADGWCDPSTYTFTTATDASAASNALLAVMNDLAPQSYWFDGMDVNGCVIGGLCDLITSYAPHNGFAVELKSFIGAEVAPSGTWYATGNGTGGDYATAASWTLVRSSTVPEPASLALLGIGLVGLGVNRKRKHKTRGE